LNVIRLKVCVRLGEWMVGLVTNKHKCYEKRTQTAKYNYLIINTATLKVLYSNTLGHSKIKLKEHKISKANRRTNNVSKALE